MSAEAEADLPAWQREKIFPAKPEGSPYGVVVGRGQSKPFETFAELENWLRDSAHPGGLIWTPERARCFPPEEESALLESLKSRKSQFAKESWLSKRSQALFLLIPLGYLLFSLGFNLQRQETGFYIVLWLMFGGLPAYEAWKSQRKATRLSEENLASEAAEVRFEIWIRRQNAPVTKVLLGLLIGVYLVQVLLSARAGSHILGALLAPTLTLGGIPQLAGLPEAGLVKAGGYHAGELWRLLTAPFLHGGLLHLAMNGLGLLYLGRRTEVMARWPHLLLVFLASMVVGGMASAYGLAKPSVGASGGILGLLGFLLVFEWLHARLVPIPATRRLVAGILLTFFIGFVGYQFIDNWAHGGGLLAGAIYGAVVFPKSSSPHRPKSTGVDIACGIFSALMLLFSAVLAVVKMKGA
ncbi:MAG: rhomboid family intramembrane serine protease [Verrucomicrobiota bacterium JB023]|nr:rhomboid family intramembrane serine protease [Verrucomicrobiota bacterium JB023]